MKFFLQFIRFESLSAVLLFIAACIALIVSNSPLDASYQHLLHATIGIHFSSFSWGMPILEWVNQGLMALFFLLVSLEIKREVILGELNSTKKILLPVIGAIGGMTIPALIYIAFNIHERSHLQGWAVPTATDIAFSLGLLNLLGKRIAIGAKVFLTALAIFDDLGAIIIIAFYYTATINGIYLGLAGICMAVLLILNYLQINQLRWYVIIGILMWYWVLLSGVHAVLAGVMLAIAIPCTKTENSPLQRLETWINPYVTLIVLPVFGLANAGINFAMMGSLTLFNALTLGCMAGLFFGKQLGVLGAIFVAVKTRIAELPDHVQWREIYGISLLCGIGFTMSLFIGALAFRNQEAQLQAVRLGVIVGSLFSAIAGYFWLRYSKKLQSNN